MSFSSVKNLLAQYSPVSDTSSSTSFSDVEKDSQLPLSKDVEASDPTLGFNASNASNNVTQQQRKSFVDARVVSDAIIGLSDGMTVPFALTAGLSTLEDTRVVVFGGLAELIAGAISMGLGGYLGAKSEEESYRAILKKTCHQTATNPETTSSLISDIFAPYELPDQLVSELSSHLADSPQLPSFLMNFHHTLPEPSGSRALTCAMTIALGYFIGGFVPLVPYFFVGPEDAFHALAWSAATMVVALFVFGYGKTCFVSGWKRRADVLRGLFGGVQMVVVGGVAAGAAMGLVKLFQVLGSR